MSSSFGKNLRLSIFGQSHSAAIGVVIDGLPAGENIDTDKIKAFMRRRAPGVSDISTARSEKDEPVILSGITNGKTCGAPLCMTIENTDIRSSDYDGLRNIPRPSHADFAASRKFRGFEDIRGGGHFSGRLTAPLCFAGSVCMQILERKGVFIAAHVCSIAGINDTQINMADFDIISLKAAAEKEIPAIDDDAALKMKTAILNAKKSGDSVGGIIECVVSGMPAGIGEPMFDGIENRLAATVFSIPGIRGIEFGAGFAASQMTGHSHNDPFYIKDGNVCTATNNHGGVLGGITSGMPIVFRAAVKPTPSIASAQQSVDLSVMRETELKITGRHDPCIVPRAVPCIEAAAAVCLLDFLLD